MNKNKGFYFKVKNNYVKNNYIYVWPQDGQPATTQYYEFKSVWNNKDKALKFKELYDDKNQWELIELIPDSYNV